MHLAKFAVAFRGHEAKFTGLQQVSGFDLFGIEIGFIVLV